MRELHRLHKVAKRQYDRGGSPADEVRDVVLHALERLSSNATSRFLADSDGYGFFIDHERGKVAVTFWAEDYGVKASDLTLDQAIGWAKSASWDNNWNVATRKLVGALICEWLAEEEPRVYKDFCGDLRRGEEVLFRDVGEVRVLPEVTYGKKTPVNTYAEAIKWAHENCVKYGWSEETTRRVDSILTQWFGS